MPPYGYGGGFGGFGGMGAGWGMGGPFWWGAPPGWTDLDLYDYNNNYVLDDNEIVDLVKDNLLADPGIPMSDAHNIDIRVSGGTATLSGAVRNPRTKPLAYTNAYWTPGVRDVVDNIEVQPPERRAPAPAPERPAMPGRPRVGEGGRGGY